MTLPTFLGIGAQRAATTWAYECLKEHPQIYMAGKKEIHFFNLNFNKGLTWYENHFKAADNYTSIGEITPNYLNNPDAIPRMAKTIPKAKLFVILREPISRAYSAYKLLHEQFKGMTFQQACEYSDYLINLSYYAKDLKRVLAHYDRESIGIYLYDDVKNRPHEMLAELYSFLGVNPHYRPKAADNIYNPVIFPGVQKIIGRIGFTPAIETIKKTPLGRWLKVFLNNKHPRRPSVSRRQEQKNAMPDSVGKEYRLLLQKKFKQDILETQEIINRDLSGWLL